MNKKISPEAKYAWVQADANVQKGYDQAINHYNLLKQSFLKTVESTGKKVEEKFVEDIGTTISNSVPNEIHKDFQSILAVANESVEDIVKNILDAETDDTNPNKELLDKIKDLNQSGVKPKDIYNKLRYRLTKVLNEQYTREAIAKKMLPKGQKGFASVKAVQDNMYGILRQVVLQRVLNGNQEIKNLASEQNFMRPLKGYYKEQLLQKGFNQIFSDVEIRARQTGDITNEQGKKIQYDILLGKGVYKKGKNQLSDIATSLDKLDFTESVSINQEIPVIGVQSKSWVAPWQEANTAFNNKYWLSFGSHASLVPTGTLRYSWHAGMYAAMQHLLQIIGPGNAIFATGVGMQWTAEVLAQFRDLNYVMAFYQSPTTGRLSNHAIMTQHEK